jgi:hypothetical protein
MSAGALSNPITENKSFSVIIARVFQEDLDLHNAAEDSEMGCR